MDLGLLLTFIAVGVAGLAAGLGIWMERDPRRPPRWAYGLSLLILMATLVTLATSYMDRKRADEDQAQQEATHELDQKAATERFEALKRESEFLKTAANESKTREEKMSDDIARMLVKLNDFAKTSDNPELNAFVSEEFKVAARSSEGVVQRVAQRVKDSGGDPEAVLAARVPPEELQRAARAIADRPRFSMASLGSGAKGAAAGGGTGAPSGGGFRLGGGSPASAGSGAAPSGGGGPIRLGGGRPKPPAAGGTPAPGGAVPAKPGGKPAPKPGGLTLPRK